MKKKLIRTATIATSLDLLLKGQLFFLSKHYNVIAASGKDEHLELVKNREGVEIADISMMRNISPLKDFVSLWKLYLFFWKEKPHIVHSITPKAGLLSMTAAYLAMVPVRMHTFTGLVFPTKTGFMKKLLIFMDKVICKMATHIYPEGEGVKNDLISYGITNKPLAVLANGNINGIDAEYFNPLNISSDAQLRLKQQLNITNEFTFVFVGRVVTDKGVNELVKAFVLLSTKYDNVKLLIVGPSEDELDPLESETSRLIKENKSILTVGNQSDIRPYLSISDVLVLPSYREGFPNVVIQAGAMKLPCIVTDINGANEIIIKEKNGLIVPPRDSTALFSAMERILIDIALRSSMSSNSRQMIVDRFDQQTVWNALLDEYKRIETNV